MALHWYMYKWKYKRESNTLTILWSQLWSACGRILGRSDLRSGLGSGLAIPIWLLSSPRNGIRTWTPVEKICWRWRFSCISYASRYRRNYNFNQFCQGKLLSDQCFPPLFSFSCSLNRSNTLLWTMSISIHTYFDVAVKFFCWAAAF